MVHPLCSFTLDLKSKIPYFSMPEEERRAIWDDGTHFTPRGYDLMGTIIAARVVELVKEREDGVAKVKEEDKEEEEIEL